MISDPDIYRAAKQVIDQQGEEAAIYAAGRADELLEEGDHDGATVWRLILAAIEELQRGRREGEGVNRANRPLKESRFSKRRCKRTARGGGARANTWQDGVSEKRAPNTNQGHASR